MMRHVLAVAAAAIAAVGIAAVGPATAETALERGSYLVNSIGALRRSASLQLPMPVSLSGVTLAPLTVNHGSSKV